MERIQRIAEALRPLDLGAGVTVEGRTFVGPEEALARLRVLEGIVEGLSGRDLFPLYERKIAHDGIFDEDINASGRYYAYLCFELKGETPEAREEALAASLGDLAERFGPGELYGRIPARIAGRQVTEAITVRPELEDFPAYYSKVRMAYAEKMAAEELPKAVLAPFRAEEERVLGGFDWTTVRVEDPAGEVMEICGDAYLLSAAAIEVTEPYRAIWSALAAAGPEHFYDIEVALDGEYPPDIDEALGRFYAYLRVSLKGQSAEERRERLLAALPAKAVQTLGAEAAAALFKESFAGEQVTASLTIRPEADDYPSYFNKRKIASGTERARKQILVDVQSKILAAAEQALGAPRKYVILERAEE